MALLTGMTADGLEVPVQVLPDGKLVAEGLEGRPGADALPVIAPGRLDALSIYIEGDVDTGIYSPGNDYLSFVGGGFEALTVGPYGVGLGGGAGKGARLAIYSPLKGNTIGKGIQNMPQVKSDTTFAAQYYYSLASTEAASFTLGGLTHYEASQGVFGAGSVVTTQYGFVAGASLIGAATNYGFFAHLPAGTNRWNFYAEGTADSLFKSNNFILANGGIERARFNASGQLLIGRDSGLAGSAAKLQCASTVNLAVSTYADNAAAKAAGLVSGDVYRKADGTLMVAY